MLLEKEFNERNESSIQEWLTKAHSKELSLLGKEYHYMTALTYDAPALLVSDVLTIFINST